MRKINKIKLFVNNNEKSEIVAKDLELELLKYDFEIVKKGKFDLGISIGGDGSFLRMVKDTNFNENIYYIGINSGTLGFLQEIDISETVDFVKRLNTNNFKVEELAIEENKIITEDNVYKFNSLNELVIRTRDFTIFKSDVLVDGELLEHYAGDGLLISTSTGSTAYNLSFNGSIVYNTLKTLVLTPIAPLNNKVYKSLLNSIIIPCDKLITLLPNNINNKLFIIVDGKVLEYDNVLRIETKTSKKQLKCLRMNDFHFAKVINQKILETR